MVVLAALKYGVSTYFPPAIKVRANELVRSLSVLGYLAVRCLGNESIC